MNNETLDKLKAILLQAQAYLATMIFKEPAKAVIDASRLAMTPSQKFFTFIKGYEGANPANNNPFDDKYYWGGYLPKYGVVKESVGGFAIFETLALGEEYGETIVLQIIEKHPEFDFYDFFALYAPTKDDNNPVAYAKAGATYMGVEPTATLKSVLNI